MTETDSPTLRRVKLGLNLGYFAPAVAHDISLVEEAEQLGYDSVWTAEAYGSDALTPLAWIAARTTTIKLGSGIFQMPARTPAMTAMAAMTLDQMSGGRLLLGLGVSGPQVVEGWHGQPYAKPLARTREYVDIVRAILRRDEPVTYRGSHYRLPYDGPDATGLGKPLKLIGRPLRNEIPIYLAAIGPRNVALAAEIADGWLPIFFSPQRFGDVYGPVLAEGFNRSGEPDKADRFDIAPSAFALVTEDVESTRMMVKPALALYVGGMGAKGRNFYYDLACRYGYERAADQIQDHYLAGEKEQAILAVPDDLVDDVSLIGSRSQIADRLEAWREAGATTLIAQTSDLTTLRTLAEILI